MRIDHVVAITGGLILLGSVTRSVGAAGAAVTAGTDVTVRVYDTSGLPPATTRRALELSSAAFAPASIHVSWLVCDDAGSDVRPHRCDEPLRRGELVIRMIAARKAAGHREPVSLGNAMVDARAGAGVLGTIYVDRVVSLAAVANADVATLLGRTIAHEMGHLLLATTAHGKHGLMRPVWTPEEVRRGHASDWTFGPRELSALRARLRARA